jgi:phosphoglycolate phosphatase-like HAD superfamily hydrolase
MKKAIVIDVNGTLSDVSRVIHFIQGAEKDWESFFDAMNDSRVPVNPMVKEMAKRFRNGHAVVLVSGAPERYQDQTVAWLNRNGIPFDAIFMRPDWDKRRGWQFKKTLFEKRLKNLYDIRLVLDDKEDACRTWREAGLQCWKLPSDMDEAAGRRSTKPGERFAHLVRPSRVRR